MTKEPDRSRDEYLIYDEGGDVKKKDSGDRIQETEYRMQEIRERTHMIERFRSNFLLLSSVFCLLYPQLTFQPAHQ